MDAVLGKMATVDEGTKAATRLGELAAELDAQLTRVGARLQFIEKLEGRINNLHVRHRRTSIASWASSSRAATRWRR